MATATPEPNEAATVTPFQGDRSFSIDGVDWTSYSRFLRIKGDRRYPKMLYLDGRLWLMTPGVDHELIKIRIDHFLHEVTVGLGIRCTATGSTTFREQSRMTGFEPDQSYYFSSTMRKSAPNRVDLRDGPPPDLVVEVIYTHAAEDTIETCRRLYVPEMWLCDERSFRILRLGAKGQYAEATSSAALPFLSGPEIDGWLRRPFEDDETSWARELRVWVGEVLGGRVRGRNT